MAEISIADRKTKLQIIRRLWGHVNDLLLHAKGIGRKSLGEIEKEIDLTEYYCRPYADCDDDELYAADVMAAARRLHDEAGGDCLDRRKSNGNSGCNYRI